MINKFTEKVNKIKDFWEKYEGKIVLFFGIFLIATISFELGILQGQKWQPDPMVIEKIPDNHIEKIQVLLNNNSGDIVKKESKVAGASNDSPQEAGKCMFVGSKNSDKYHKMDCRWATQIKSDNAICFKDKEDAENQGYVPASCLK